METGLEIKPFVIVKGYVDAKDERGNSVYGTLLGLVARKETKYLSVMFSHDETSKTMSWSDLLFLHREREKEKDRSPFLAHQEEELFNYLESSMALNLVARNHNTKQAEQSISRFCMEKMALKAVTFREFTDATEQDMDLFNGDDKQPENKDAADGAPQAEDAESGDKPEESKDAEAKDEHNDIVVKCDPVLDPVHGVAMNELRSGECVMVKMRDDSVFFKLLARNVPSFDGVVKATVTGILQSELGTATVGLELSGGVTGVMQMSGKVKIRIPGEEEEMSERERKVLAMPESLVFGVASAVVLISAIAIIYYITR
jgi:hypothetical protein